MATYIAREIFPATTNPNKWYVNGVVSRTEHQRAFDGGDEYKAYMFDGEIITVGGRYVMHDLDICDECYSNMLDGSDLEEQYTCRTCEKMSRIYS